MTRPSLRTVLVTGAAVRIGRAIALDLGRGGWSVAVHHHTHRAEAEEVVAEIRAAGGRAVALAADLMREAETEALIERVTEALGPVGCLINNASVFEADRVETATRASWDRHLEVNLRAPFVLTQRFAHQLPDDETGNVIHLLDQRVWKPTPFFMSYTMSKSALWTLTRTMALALAPRIRVNAIGPGPTLRSARQSDEDFRRQWESTPLRHGPGLDEVTAAVRFILEAGSMTGQMIALDGGQHLGWAQPHRDPTP
jgi:NAD(P)-dependent dehydrogenase (short-subunit alcohol dehydrogenase family)